MNGFRISGFPAATNGGLVPTGATSASSNSGSNPTAVVANSNKFNAIVGSHHNINDTSPYVKPFNLMTTSTAAASTTTAGPATHNKSSTPNGSCPSNYLCPGLMDDELGLHIREGKTSTVTSNSALSMLQPSPPPLTTEVPSSVITTAPIALKGNNPFLNSPSPTDNKMPALSSASAAAAFNFHNEVPEYAEPQRYQRVVKPMATQQPNIPVYASTNKETINRQINSAASTAISAVTSQSSQGFVDYMSQQQLRQQQLTLQQQQRLLQLTRQQQQLRQAVSMVASSTSSPTTLQSPAAAAASSTTTNRIDTTINSTPATTPSSSTSSSSHGTSSAAMDKEAIYAALYQQYRQSPTNPVKSAGSNSPGNYCPPLPLHRNLNSSAGGVQSPTLPLNGGQPVVPRRSHSTPRPIASLAGSQTAANSTMNNNGNMVPGVPNAINGQRPRSLDRFSSIPAPSKASSSSSSNNTSPYQPPPIPLRRFAPGAANQKRTVSSPQPGEQPKFQGKKSTSIDNIRSTLASTEPLATSTGTMRHSVTFHGRPQTQIGNENGFSVEDLKSQSNQQIPNSNSAANSWQKTSERPMSYAYGGTAPDQDYLENQLRAYSDQLRTITESVRKYSEQAKLLSELKRQQHLAKQQQMGNSSTSSVNASQQSLDQSGTNCSSLISSSKSTGNFSSSMISQEIVSKSLASLNATEAQTPSTQLKMFLDNIRSSMRTEYQQNIPEEVLKPIKDTKTAHTQHNPSTLKRNSLVEDSCKQNSPVKSASKSIPAKDKEPATPSDKLRLFLDAIRANKIPENEDKPAKMVNSQTLDSFITKPLQMPDVTSGTPGNNGPPSRRRPKSSSLTTPNSTTATTNAPNSGSNNATTPKLEHSLTTSESFHQISDNLRLMSEDLKALSPSKVVNSHSSNSLKALAATTSELRVISTSPLATSPSNRPPPPPQQLIQPFPSSHSNSSISSLANSTNTNTTTSSSATSTPSTAPLMTDFNEILDSFQQMADKYKSKGSYDYLRKCSDALRQHSQQLKAQQQLRQQQHQANNGGAYMPSSSLVAADDSTSTPGSIREAVQNLLMQPRNGFQILDDRMRLFIDIIDSQDKLSQVSVDMMLGWLG